jgi:hypothetical protein
LGRPQQQGYHRAIAEMTQRFDVNNKEMNRKKFQEQTQHLISKKRKEGAKFASQKCDMTLTPDHDEMSKSPNPTHHVQTASQAQQQAVLE